MDFSSTAMALLATYFVYYTFLVIYRLTFHRLAQFPGPKLTAATGLPLLYYDLIHKGGGQFPFAYRKWHDQYGPIIRVSPDELHIRDSSFYGSTYATNKPTRKWEHFSYRFSNENTAHGAVDPKAHRVLRSTMNPFYSRQRVAEYAPKLQDMLSKLLVRIEKDYMTSARVLNITKMWECYASDVVVDFCFDYSYHYLDLPEFHSKINDAAGTMTEITHWLRAFGFLAWLLRNLPGRLISLDPAMGELVRSWADRDAQVADILQAQSRGEKLGDRTIFASLLEQQSSLPPAERLPLDLGQEAKMVIAAGSETIARACTVGSFHILANPLIKEKLHLELIAAIPDPTNMPTWDALTRLAYLSACIEESVRLTYGLAERRARAYDGGPITYTNPETNQQYLIPTGTFISMDNYDVSHDEAIFPNSHKFVPERWLNDPKAPDGKPLSRYSVSFGKGSRNCVGMQLAYAELYMAFANFFRADFIDQVRLYEPSAANDVEMARCRFVPRPKKNSLGVRVIFDAKK